MFTRMLSNRAAPVQPRLATGPSLLLGSQSRFGFARYRNRAQATALGMKDNMLSYEF